MIGDYNHVQAGRLVQQEMDRQNRMWGIGRPDHANGELVQAVRSQLQALSSKQSGASGFEMVPSVFPEGWSGFRDYGSDIANLVVAAAWLQQEIARKLRAGEDDTRLPRNTKTQPYEEGKGKPEVQL